MARSPRLRWWLAGLVIVLGLVTVVFLAVEPPGWDEWGDTFIYGAVAVAVLCGMLCGWA